MSSWLRVAPALVMDSPQSMVANGSKPYKLDQIRELGFWILETLVATDSDVAKISGSDTVP